jgi:hypothetical protein
MKRHHFSVIATRDDRPTSGQDAIGDWLESIAERLADRLGGHPDLSVQGHAHGLELSFHRDAATLESALTSAMDDIRAVGLDLVRVEFQPEEIAASLATM